MKPIDLLIITPLPEEEDALKHWLGNRDSFTYLRYDVYRTDFRNISVGTFCINGMGSVNASIKCSKIIDTYRPRIVILLGIAAGHPLKNTMNLKKKKTGKFKKGFVGYNKTIYYCSYGKVKEEGHDILSAESFEFRALVLDQNEWLTKCAESAKSNDWASDAHRWYSKELNFGEKWRKHFRVFPPQLWPNYDLQATLSDVASGELVIANEEWKQLVMKSFPAAKIEMFEMEAYAVGKVCDYYDIPFITIRGISDYGDGKKDDKYRLCSTLTASSFVKSMLLTNSFITEFSKIHKSDYHYLNTCPVREVKTFCPHQEQECVEIGFTIPQSKPSWLSKVFENVTPHNYSHELSNHLISNFKDSCITFFFPYSPRTLLNFFVNHSDNKSKLDKMCKELENLSITNGKKASKEYYELLKEVANIGRTQFNHFSECDILAEKLRKKHGGKRLAQFINRVIIIDENIDDNRELIMNPIYHLYTVFLKDSVPTYWINKDKLRNDKIIVEDITFMENKMPSLIERKINNSRLMAIRFYENSEMLLITGMPCSTTGLNNNHNNISGSYYYWRNILVDSIDKHKSIHPFCEFPHEQIKKILI